MKTKKRSISLFALIIPLLLLATGCDIATNGTTQSTKPLAVKMQIQSSGTTPNSVAKKSSTTQALDSLTQVKLLVDKIELKNSNESEGENGDSQGEHQDSVDFEAKNLVVDLPLDG